MKPEQNDRLKAADGLSEPLTRRLWSWRDEFGNESHWSRELGRAVMAAGADALWPTITTW